MSNPFLPSQVEGPTVEELEDDPIMGGHASILGISSPRVLRNVAAEPLATHPVITASSVWLVGASGGVGVTTLAQLCGDEVIDGGTHPPMWQSQAFVVAATHGAGLEAAALLARKNARGELTYDVLGIVLVSDRPKLSKETTVKARAIGGMYPQMMVVPFEASWREPGVVPTESSVRLRRVLKTINLSTQKKGSPS